MRIILLQYTFLLSNRLTFISTAFEKRLVKYAKLKMIMLGKKDDGCNETNQLFYWTHTL